MNIDDPIDLAEEHLSPEELETLNLFRKEYRQHRNILVGEDEEMKSGRDVGSSLVNARSSRFSGEINFPAMVKTASMIVKDEATEDDEEEQVEYMNLPPLVLSQKAKQARKKSKLDSYLNYLDPILNNLGSLCFIFGSLFFIPSFESRFCDSVEEGEAIGAVAFLVGSVFFLLTSIITFIRSGALTSGNSILLANGLMYIIGNVLFIAGCVYFIPPEDDLDTGLDCFIIGSVIYIVAPLMDAYRATQLYIEGGIKYENLLGELLVIALYTVGGIVFVVGCIYYYPSLYQSWAVWLFLLGSVCFLLATLTAPAMRWSRKRERAQKRLAAKLNRLTIDHENVRINVSKYGSLYVTEDSDLKQPFIDDEQQEKYNAMRSESVPDMGGTSAHILSYHD